jgi:hypothetical protein
MPATDPRFLILALFLLLPAVAVAQPTASDISATQEGFVFEGSNTDPELPTISVSEASSPEVQQAAADPQLLSDLVQSLEAEDEGGRPPETSPQVTPAGKKLRKQIAKRCRTQLKEPLAKLKKDRDQKVMKAQENKKKTKKIRNKFRAKRKEMFSQCVRKHVAELKSQAPKRR